MNVNRLAVNVRRYGSAEPLPERISLRAGPLSLFLEAGDLRYISHGEREIVRRIYVAVRDRDWNTIAPRLSEMVINAEDDHFHVTFTAVHQQDEIDFRWRGEITGERDGTITYSMDGAAYSTFWRNRIGCCILHPPKECSGQPCTIEHPDGNLTEGRFPTFISPHQPFIDIRAISYEIAAGVKAEVRCEGDIFEMEDQRNWSDASFKTYSTPLSLPRPFEVLQGTKIKQKITIKLNGELRAASALSSEISVTFDHHTAFPLPRPGLRLTSLAPLSETETRRLKALRLSHLRFDLNLSRPDLESSLKQAGEIANQIGVSLELALFLSDHAAEELKNLAAVLTGIKIPIHNLLIFHAAETSTSGKWIELAQTTLRALLPRARFVSGTNNYFTELNRERPSVKSLDAICYSLNPQVHSVDHTSVMENLAAQTATALSAHQFADGRDVAVTPITLRSRSNSNDRTEAMSASTLPPSVDVRQMSLFAAAWTVGSLRYIAEGGVTSATYYETIGWRGVMESESGCLRPDLFPSWPGAVFPLYHVFADVGEYIPEEALRLFPAVTNHNDLKVSGFALQRNNGRRVLLANLTPERQQVSVNGLPETLRLKVLDETNVERAMTAPEEFRAQEGESKQTNGGELQIELLPYAVARLDY